MNPFGIESKRGLSLFCLEIYNSGNPQPFPFPWLWESEHLASMAKIPRKEEEEEGFFSAFHLLFHLGSVSSLGGASFLPLDKRKKGLMYFCVGTKSIFCFPTTNHEPQNQNEKDWKHTTYKRPFGFFYFYASLCSFSLYYV